jgi:hypothetical protein
MRKNAHPLEPSSQIELQNLLNAEGGNQLSSKAQGLPSRKREPGHMTDKESCAIDGVINETARHVLSCFQPR